MPGFPQTLPQLPSPAGFALNPFAVVNLSRGSDYVLNTVSTGKS